MSSRPRRVSRAMVSVVAFSLAAAACGSGGGANEAQLVRSTVPRAKALGDDAVTGGAVAGTVAAKLYPLFAQQAGSKNLAYSPASIAIALGMVRAGAQGLSARQLDSFLASRSPDTLARSLNGLSAALDDRAGTQKNSGGQDAKVELNTANSLWGQAGVTWKNPFLDVLQREYGVGMYEVDYEDDPQASRAQINHWVSDRTHQKIPHLLPEDVITRITRLTLVNALYLAAPWDREFTKEGDGDFHTAAGVVKAPMMRAHDMTTYRKGDHWQAVTIPYAGNELAMTVLVPDSGSLAAVESKLDTQLLTQIATPVRSGTTVHLVMPRFDIDSKPNLTDALKAAGVTEPFVTGQDFTPITEDPDASPLYLAAMVHEATVTVDEKGTVAAAATGAVFDQVGAPLNPVELTVDRPFLFVISDVATRAPLFVGRITDPTKH
jgi:serpin B